MLTRDSRKRLRPKGSIQVQVTLPEMREREGGRKDEEGREGGRGEGGREQE